jgi:hypothetical protein
MVLAWLSSSPWRCRFALFLPQHRRMCSRDLGAASAGPAQRGRTNTRVPSRDKPATQRVYFYYVDLHGRLYLDEDGQLPAAATIRPKVFNIATCLKEPKFLDFFFRQMRVNDLEAAHRADGYGHVSPCGRELNFVRAADTGVVFSRLEGNRLFYAPTLSVEYDMTALAVSEIGRVYHPAPAHLGGRALLASALVDSLIAPAIQVDDDGTFILDVLSHQQVLRQHSPGGAVAGDAENGGGADGGNRFLRLAAHTDGA